MSFNRKVQAKKSLGQHFLVDENICQDIVGALPIQEKKVKVVEVGPGMGAITKYLLERTDLDLTVFELDREAAKYIETHFPQLKGKIEQGDFLKAPLSELLGPDNFWVVGNFPYNISSQIIFKCLEHREQIPLIMGMFQREVAVRLAEKPGSKDYGITSVLFQAYYDIKYCFSVEPGSFSPPPKVRSGVIICTRNTRTSMPCNEKDFFTVVKMAFNQRRKTLRNSLKAVLGDKILLPPFEKERPEQLSVDQFIQLTQFIYE